MLPIVSQNWAYIKDFKILGESIKLAIEYQNKKVNNLDYQIWIYGYSIKIISCGSKSSIGKK